MQQKECCVIHWGQSAIVCTKCYHKLVPIESAFHLQSQCVIGAVIVDTNNAGSSMSLCTSCLDL